MAGRPLGTRAIAPGVAATDTESGHNPTTTNTAAANIERLRSLEFTTVALLHVSCRSSRHRNQPRAERVVTDEDAPAEQDQVINWVDDGGGGSLRSIGPTVI